VLVQNFKQKLEHKESNKETGFPHQHAHGDITVTTKIAQIIVLLTHDVRYETIAFQSYEFKDTQTFLFHS